MSNEDINIRIVELFKEKKILILAIYLPFYFLILSTIYYLGQINLLMAIAISIIIFQITNVISLVFIRNNRFVLKKILKAFLNIRFYLSTFFYSVIILGIPYLFYRITNIILDNVFLERLNEVSNLYFKNDYYNITLPQQSVVRRHAEAKLLHIDLEWYLAGIYLIMAVVIILGIIRYFSLNFLAIDTKDSYKQILRKNSRIFKNEFKFLNSYIMSNIVKLLLFAIYWVLTVCAKYILTNLFAEYQSFISLSIDAISLLVFLIIFFIPLMLFQAIYYEKNIVGKY